MIDHIKLCEIQRLQNIKRLAIKIVTQMSALKPIYLLHLHLFRTGLRLNI